VPALERIAGIRVVTTAEALDAARWSGDDVDVVRFAPDEAFGIGATGVVIDGDPDAIVEPEAGYVAALLDLTEVATLAAHTEWPITGAEPVGSVAQGKIAGVPAKLLFGDPTILLTQAAYADELRSRLRW
jgi:hypothetical protein